MAKISETYQSRLLSASELKPGEEYEKTIIDATVETLPGFEGKPDRVSVVISLNPPNGKPARAIALNKTQALEIAQFLDDDTDKWPGQNIIIGTRQVKVGANVQRSFTFRKPGTQPSTEI